MACRCRARTSAHHRNGGAARSRGRLYACNTAGAAAGAFVSTWVLLPAYGLERTLQMSALVNLFAAAGVLPLFLKARLGRGEALERDRSPAFAPDVAAMAPRSAADDACTVPFGVWALIYAWSGFLDLSLEIVWFSSSGVLKSPRRVRDVAVDLPDRTDSVPRWAALLRRTALRTRSSRCGGRAIYPVRVTVLLAASPTGSLSLAVATRRYEPHGRRPASANRLALRGTSICLCHFELYIVLPTG